MESLTCSEALRCAPPRWCRAYSIQHRGTEVGRDDDPRWTAIKAEYWAASDRKAEIAWSFVDQPPSTTKGVAAIFAYADEYEEAGYEWPDRRHHFTASGAYAGDTEEDWRQSLSRAIIPVLCAAPFPTAAGSSPMPKARDADAELLLRLGAEVKTAYAELGVVCGALAVSEKGLWKWMDANPESDEEESAAWIEEARAAEHEANNKSSTALSTQCVRRRRARSAA